MADGLHHIIAVCKRLPLLLILFASLTARGQGLSDTLDEVKIRNARQQRSTDERINSFSPGQKIVTIDSATLRQYQMQSVANLLAQQTPVFVKSYGINGLATLNIRGSSAAQSQVLWNGVPVNNAALGLADVSLLPVSMINKMNLVYGSSAALYGSGNVGGAILLETDEPFFDRRPKYELALGIGSFGQYQMSGKFAAGRKKWYSGTSLFVQSAQNDFKYTDEYGARKTTENSALRGIAAQQQIAYRSNEHNTFRLTGWYQNYYRLVPAATFETFSEKERHDANLRVLFDWNKVTGHSHSYFKTAFFRDHMQYDDDTIALHSDNDVSQYFAEAGWSNTIHDRHKILVFVPVHVSWADYDHELKYQSKYAIAASYRYTDLKSKFSGAINLRSEMINDLFVFLPGVNASFRLSPTFTIKANVQKTYRAPTLNELYYQPGGNNDLKAEHGWSEELGYELNTLLGNIKLSHSVSGFHRLIDDWILWLGGSIWTPHNIAQVRSAGIETENLIAFSIHDWKFHLGLNASYVSAKTMSSDIPGDGSVGKQIPYTPVATGLINIGFDYRKLTVNLGGNYTGKRYINTDETGLLKAYQTVNCQISYILNISSKMLCVSLMVNNLLNSRYEIINGRPMPGANWLAGVTLISP